MESIFIELDVIEENLIKQIDLFEEKIVKNKRLKLAPNFVITEKKWFTKVLNKTNIGSLPPKVLILYIEI
jgi:hypothetical protein